MVSIKQATLNSTKQWLDEHATDALGLSYTEEGVGLDGLYVRFPLPDSINTSMPGFQDATKVASS